MGYRRRICFTEKQKAEIWDRWQRVDSMSSIGWLFDCQTASNADPVSASKIDPLGAELARRCVVSM